MTIFARLGDIKRKHLKLCYQHNVIRAHLELLLGRRLLDCAPKADAKPDRSSTATMESCRT